LLEILRFLVSALLNAIKSGTHFVSCEHMLRKSDNHTGDNLSSRGGWNMVRRLLLRLPPLKHLRWKTSEGALWNLSTHRKIVCTRPPLITMTMKGTYTKVQDNQTRVNSGPVCKFY